MLEDKKIVRLGVGDLFGGFSPNKIATAAGADSTGTAIDVRKSEAYHQKIRDSRVVVYMDVIEGLFNPKAAFQAVCFCVGHGLAFGFDTSNADPQGEQLLIQSLANQFSENADLGAGGHDYFKDVIMRMKSIGS